VLIVAVHDVAPSTLPQVRWLLAELDGMGVSRRVLKVIPAEPGADTGGQSDLAELLAAEAAAGSEIVLHGWTHASDGALRGRLVDTLRARLFAAHSAEFLALEPQEMVRRLEQGMARLAGWGAPAVGFCPPAWLAAPELLEAAAAAGLRYIVTLRGLRDLARDRWLTLPPIGYMGTGGLQESLVGVGGRLLGDPLCALLRPNLHRVFLHPQGARDSAACHRCLDRIRRLAVTHRATTYRELLHA